MDGRTVGWTDRQTDAMLIAISPEPIGWGIKINPCPAVTRTVAPLVEHLLCDWDVAGSIPSGIIQKTLKMVLAALLLGAQH